MGIWGTIMEDIRVDKVTSPISLFDRKNPYGTIKVVGLVV